MLEFTIFSGQGRVARPLNRNWFTLFLLAPSVVAINGNRDSGLVVAKEASACEVVPIGTYHGGIPEIIDDAETGYLVPERMVDPLADRLTRLLADPELRNRMGKAARRKMKSEYDVTDRVEALEDIYDEACRRRR